MPYNTIFILFTLLITKCYSSKLQRCDLWKRYACRWLIKWMMSSILNILKLNLPLSQAVPKPKHYTRLNYYLMKWHIKEFGRLFIGARGCKAIDSTKHSNLLQYRQSDVTVLSAKCIIDKFDSVSPILWI